MSRIAVVVLSAALLWANPSLVPDDGRIDTARERARVLSAAGRYLKDAPITVTASRSSRSAGGPHDFFSEGDYWWPDPVNPDGPYIQRDGMSNPGNFTDHRRAPNAARKRFRHNEFPLSTMDTTDGDHPTAG